MAPSGEHEPASAVAAIWRVHPRVEGAASRRRARAAAGLLFALVILAFLDVAGTFAGAYGRPTAFDLAVGVASAVGIVAAYALVRLGYVTPGVVVALAVMVVAIASYRPNQPSETETQLLYFLAMPLLLAGLLLPLRSAAATSGLIVAAALTYEWMLDHQAGEPFDAADTSLLLLLSATAILSVAAAAFAARDATALDQRTEALDRARRELEDAAVARRRMFNQVAHDLANPLSPILLQTRILETANPEQTVKGLAIVRRNVEALQKQVDDLKDLARVENSTLRLVLARLDVAALAQDAAESLRAPAENAGLALHVMASPGLAVMADQVRLNQVFYNLVGNAIKFTPPGGTVTIAARLQTDKAVVEVTDSGRGLSQEEIVRLFQRFVQVHTAGEVAERGSGLGLYIAKGIVEAHNGAIQVTSAGRGQGSTFTFQLPLAPAVDGPA